MIRFCPNCTTERQLSELFCEGEVEGRPCGWDLSSLPLRPKGWRPPVEARPVQPSQAAGPRCPQGHDVAAGDLICPECGADLDEPDFQPAASEEAEPARAAPQAEADVRIVAGWRLGRRIASASRVRERYEAVRVEDGHEALLTLYADGSEPDPEVYELLRTLDRDHVPEIVETGHWQERAYEVSEDLRGGSLADLGLLPNDLATLSRVLSEIGGALAAFAERGLRHRDLRPGAIMVRERDPLDLVITGFGSARLSDFDLDIVSPLETTRYTAPEAVAGGVAAASDWWSLGMILLEQVTRGQCFGGADDQTFLISVLTDGAPIPDGLDPRVDRLLRGLLARDRRERWGWEEAQLWLDGGSPPVPQSSLPPDHGDSSGRRIGLGGKPYVSLERFALAAARDENWEEAAELLGRGEIATWLQDAGAPPALRAEVRRITELHEVDSDIRLAVALKALNPAMPLVVRGEIVTPGWLLGHADAAFDLITGPIPDLLEAKDSELWLARMKAREQQVRARARQLGIALDEDQFRVHILSTSRSRLAALWEERRRALPDTDHPGLLALLDRRIGGDEDYILLLGADLGQFRAAEGIVEEAASHACACGIVGFNPESALAWLERPRRELHAAIDARIEGFAQCGIERVDQWADQFRLERRLPAARALALLSVAEDAWRQPPRQQYVANLLDFFSRRITAASLRGPLVKMAVSKTSKQIDLTELGSPRVTAKSLLDHLLLRTDRKIELDPAALAPDPRIERRIRSLHAQATLYRRDTGIDGLYLGFPFLVTQDPRGKTVPKVAPVLLWPIRLRPETGARGRVILSFDPDREEVRLNPAFGSLLGPENAERWREAADEMLGRSSVTGQEVIEAFSHLAEADGSELKALPGRDVRVSPGEDRLACSAVLFHLSYLGQAVMEDLRQLKAIPPGGSGLETALRAGEEVHRAEVPKVGELERFFTGASDPSQEAAVLEARMGRGLLVEGPPGTGKSQTIVNMVADAIGSGRSLLVVCQKQAALEVVNKRLEGERLGDRIVMVNDVNKDREPVIRAIREQLERLWERPHGTTAWRQSRVQTAARIEALEADLDSHHGALHAIDEQTGLSYRLILGELIGLKGAGTPIPVPGLRARLGPLDPGSVTTIAESCGPLARLWLPARYEGSALAATLPFAPDEDTLTAFRSDFETFAAAESERLAVIARTPDAIAIEDPEPYRAWAEANAAILRGIGDTDRERLARWLPLFQNRLNQAPGGAPLQQRVANVQQGLSQLAPDTAPQEAIAVAVSLDSAMLGQRLHDADALAAKAGFFAKLSPARWLLAWRHGRFLKVSGGVDADAMRTALHREAALRPLRQGLEGAIAEAGEPAHSLDLVRVPDLGAIAARLRAALGDTEALVRRLGDYPTPPTAFAMARTGTRQAVEDLLGGIDQGLARQAARTASRTAMHPLDNWFAPDWRAQRQEAITCDTSSALPLAEITAALPHAAAYQRFRPRVAQLDAVAIEVFSGLAKVRDMLEALPAAELEPAVRRIIAREARLAWKTRLETENPSLLFEAEELEAKAVSLAAADKEMRELNRRMLVEGLDARELRPLREWEDITRLRGQRARRLREFIDRGAELGLMKLRPVWLVNPDVASRLLPLRKALFDTVIYDEASQMPIEYALPTLFRSSRVIVSGDEKQMPPSAFFTGKADTDEDDIFEGHDSDAMAEEAERAAEEEAWSRREIKDCPDLLQLAKTVLPSTTLQIHYRSAYRELISFSNASFYGNRLSVPVRHPAEEVKRIRPIEMVHVDGLYDGQTNRTEAEEVVDHLADMWREGGTRKTVGVVTFNRKQADLIETVLEERAERDAAFRAALAGERERFEEGEDMSFFVKNVENVQGDERDIIIFSSTFGRNAQGTFRRNFGVLGQTGGERRLNVAVTRAREKVLLVTSMSISEISDLLSTRRQAASPRDFLQAYFEYARAMSAGELQGAGALLSRLTPELKRAHPASEDLDGFEASVAAEIERLGWSPVRAAEEGAFSVDFAIEDPQTGLYGIGIECDAPRHRLLAAARAREMWRPKVLGRSIPRLHRVSSHGWYHEPERERARLAAAIEQGLGRAG